MITSLRTENFKCWADTGDLRFAPLTGFFGTNSSGKTSILQTLLMLKQTAESPDRKRVLHMGDARSLVDLGTFYDLIRDHVSSETFRMALKWDLAETLKVNDPEKKSTPLYTIDSLAYCTSIREAMSRPVVDRFAYTFDANEFGMERKRSENSDEKDEYDLVHGGYPARRMRGRAWPLPSPVKCYGFPDEVTAYYQNTGFLSDLVLAFEELFSRTSYLGPLREYPQRNYVWAGDSPADVGRKGELAVHAMLTSRARGNTISRGRGRPRQSVEERVAQWLRELGLIHSFTLESIASHRKDYELRVRTKPRSASVLITEVGFGVSQILPVLVLCYYVPQNSVIVLEQPEIHLHPSVQAGLADVFIDVVTTRNVQIVLESHSEHLLRRLQRRIAEEGLSHEGAALYFCHAERGVARCENLDLDRHGYIRNWPNDFFGDEMGELAAQAEAAMSRSGVSRS